MWNVCFNVFLVHSILFQCWFYSLFLFHANKLIRVGDFTVDKILYRIFTVKFMVNHFMLFFFSLSGCPWVLFNYTFEHTHIWNGGERVCQPHFHYRQQRIVYNWTWNSTYKVDENKNEKSIYTHNSYFIWKYLIVEMKRVETGVLVTIGRKF